MISDNLLNACIYAVEQLGKANGTVYSEALTELRAELEARKKVEVQKAKQETMLDAIIRNETSCEAMITIPLKEYAYYHKIEDTWKAGWEWCQKMYLCIDAPEFKGMSAYMNMQKDFKCWMETQGFNTRPAPNCGC